MLFGKARRKAYYEQGMKATPGPGSYAEFS